MSYAKKALAAASALLMGTSVSAAPLVLEGNYVKIGTNDAGTVGSGGNTSPGILYDSTGTATFNPAYDYLTPGSPFEGWTVKGIDTDGTTVLFNYTNNNTNVSSPAITGTLVDKSGVEYRGLTFDNRAVWSGSVTEFDIEHDYRFNDNQQFVDINTRLDFKINVPTLYFGRFTDPDARAADGDSSSTLNVRGYAGGVPETNVVLSEALASKYALGLFTGASNSNTGISAGWTTDPIEYYNGVNDGDGDYTIGMAFMFSGISAGDIVNIQYAYIFGPSSYDAAAGAVAGGAGGATSSSFTVTDVGSASAPTTTPSTPTVTGTSTTDSVTTSTSSSSTTSTSYVTRTETSTDADGNPVVKTYTDTVVTTTPVDTTTTTTTPVTTTTYSDGTSTTTNGTPVVTYSSVNGSPTSTVTGTTLDSTAVTRPSIVTSNAPTASLPVLNVKLTEHTASENGGVQKIARKHTTTTTTAMTRTLVNTPVTTSTAADGTETVTEGTPTTTYEFWNDVKISYDYDSLYGRVDQHEVLDKISGGFRGILNHTPSSGGQKARVFGKNYLGWSNADNGYYGKTKIFGGGFEIDVKPTWTLGAQYNNMNVDLDGSDSTSKLRTNHYGVFSMMRGNTLSLRTNAGFAQNKYSVSRNVQGVFNNDSETSGQEWWVNNRLYWHVNKSITPFVGYTVGGYHRDGFAENGSIQSTRRVDEVNKTTHTGEAGLSLTHRFGGKKNDRFGIGVEASVNTSADFQVVAAVDYNQTIYLEGLHQIADGINNTAVSAKVKFRF